MSHNPIIPIACDLTAIPPQERAEHRQNSERIFQRAIDTQELPNGYAFRFTNEKGLFLAIATFVEYERRCCPFFTFTLQVESGSRSLWLSLTGDNGVKEFIQAQFLH